MVIYDRGQLGQAAKGSGFVRDIFEKAGGTAINMTIFDLPRLSVDLDLILLRICPWRI